MAAKPPPVQRMHRMVFATGFEFPTHASGAFLWPCPPMTCNTADQLWQAEICKACKCCRKTSALCINLPSRRSQIFSAPSCCIHDTCHLRQRNPKVSKCLLHGQLLPHMRCCAVLSGRRELFPVRMEVNGGDAASDRMHASKAGKTGTRTLIMRYMKPRTAPTWAS